MKPIILFFLSCWVSAACWSQSSAFNQGGTSDKNYYAEIPYETVNNKIVIEVEIGGRKHRFLFDTGATMSISDGLATELMAPELSRIPVSDATGKQDTITTVDLKEIKLGNIVFNDVPALRTLGELHKCLNLDGVVGSNILRSSIVQIIPERHVIILTDNIDKLSLKKKNSIPMMTNADRQSSPHINVLFRGKRNVNVDLEFDTGGDEFLALNEEYLRLLGQYNVCEITERGFGSSLIGQFGAGASDSTFRVRVPLLSVAETRFDSVFTETIKHGMSRMGARLLNYGTVTLDYLHGKFYFEANQPIYHLNEPHWPLSPVFINNKLLIGVVWGKMNEQIKPGDQIMAIGDVPCSTVDLCTWMTHNQLREKRTDVTLTIRDANGATREVAITKQ